MQQKEYIENSNTVRLNLDKKTNDALNEKKLNKILHQRCHLYYGKIRHVPKLGNSNRSLYLRQQFAKVMINQMWEGKAILNIDQSPIGQC